MKKRLPNPFCRPAPSCCPTSIPYVQVCDVRDRLEMVKKMGLNDLERVVAMGPTVQISVLRAANRRIERITAEAWNQGITPKAVGKDCSL